MQLRCRSSHGSVSNNPPLDNFHPSDAIESLHAATLRIQTIVQTASDAVDQLHCPSEPAERRAFARMQILVSKAADEASAALAEGDRFLVELSRHLSSGSHQRDRPPRPEPNE